MFHWSRVTTKSGNVYEVVISTILTALILVSGILSETPEDSLLRGFSIAASGLGGFWCARILVTSSGRRAFFTWFCTAVLGAMIVLSLLGYLLSGSPDRFLDVNPHPLASRMLLLAFAPLALVLGGVKRNMIVGASILCLGYCCLLSHQSQVSSAHSGFFGSDFRRLRISKCAEIYGRFGPIGGDALVVL